MNGEASPAPSILVADDEEGLLFLMVDALRREGFEAEGCATGEEAFAWLDQHAPDLLLLDLKLANLSALEFVERLRAKGREFPFVIVTGHGDERTAVEAMKQGALDYVMKDAGMLELLPAIVRRAFWILEREKRLRLAMEEIRQREERHLEVIQTALDGFVVFERDGRVLEVNQALADLLGIPVDQMIGRNALHSANSVFRSEVKQQAMDLEDGSSTRCFTRLARADGSEIEVEVSLRRRGLQFVGFVHDVSTQRRLEREFHQITLEERRRFGHELHDGLGQQLTALEMMTHTLARELKTVAPPQMKAALEITKLIRQAITQTRELAHGLSPVADGAEGLANALQRLAQITSAAGVACEFECGKDIRLKNDEVALNFYRIAQEAVTNALKHARPQRIRLRLEDGHGITLSIEDDGKGMPRRKSSFSGMGLQVMQHRASLIGATLQIESRPKQGVRVICSLPETS